MNYPVSFRYTCLMERDVTLCEEYSHGKVFSIWNLEKVNLKQVLLSHYHDERLNVKLLLK